MQIQYTKEQVLESIKNLEASARWRLSQSLEALEEKTRQESASEFLRIKERAEILKKVLTGLSAVAIMFSCALSSAANLTFLSEKPANPLKMSDAVASKTPIQQCRQVRLSPTSGAFVVKPGTENTFHATVPTGIENAEELVIAGKPVYRCTEVERSTEKHKFVTVK